MIIHEEVIIFGNISYGWAVGGKGGWVGGCLDYHGTTVATTANKRRCALQIWVQAIINY